MTWINNKKSIIFIIFVILITFFIFLDISKLIWSYSYDCESIKISSKCKINISSLSFIDKFIIDHFNSLRMELYLIIFVYIIFRYLWIKYNDYKKYKDKLVEINPNQYEFITCIRYISMNKKLYIFSVMLYFVAIIIDYSLNNYSYKIEKIWPVIAITIAPFASAAYSISNNVWQKDRERDIVTGWLEPKEVKELSNSINNGTNIEINAD